MEPLTKHQGVAALLDRSNVDTDQIIPKQFLKKTGRTGYGKHLFHDWRYLENGDDNPNFELNQPVYNNSSILVTGDNFGCGSSREHAPWAIRDYGFKIIISTGYADIFYNNCFKNGILPIKTGSEELAGLMSEIRANPGVEFAVDLEKQFLSTPGGKRIFFDVEAFRKDCLMKGMDEIEWTLRFQTRIKAFESDQALNQPWLWRE